MTIYCLMIDDRHADAEAHLFSTPEKAINAAKKYLANFSESSAYIDKEDVSMSEHDLEKAGLLFYECYSVEGDCVWVLPREIDEDDA